MLFGGCGNPSTCSRRSGHGVWSWRQWEWWPQQHLPRRADLKSHCVADTSSCQLRLSILACQAKSGCRDTSQCCTLASQADHKWCQEWLRISALASSMLAKDMPRLKTAQHTPLPCLSSWTDMLREMASTKRSARKPLHTLCEVAPPCMLRGGQQNRHL